MHNAPSLAEEHGQQAARTEDTGPSAPESGTPLKPFLKWAGGKTRLLNRLLPLAPETFENYHEPFVGGGAMFFAHGRRAQGRCYLADLNAELVNVWCAIQTPTDEFRRGLEYYAREDSEEFYYRTRSNGPDDPARRAAWFVYLNQTAWNGLWRVNAKGEFNVPWGQREFRGLPSNVLDRHTAALDGVSIREEDFRESLKRTEPGDFVYLDPPYLPLSETSKFYFYTKKRFRQPDLEELADLCAQLTDRGVRWMLSNRDTPLVRKLFAGAEVVGLTAHRSVAAQNGIDREKRKSPEVIIRGGYD